MHSTFSIRADWIWTGVGNPLANGCITLENDRIVSVTRASPASAFDLGPYCILPGLINSHTHLEFSDLRHPVPVHGSFADWILDVVQHRRKVASENSAPKVAAVREGLVESRSFGVRLVLDIVHASVEPTASSDLTKSPTLEISAASSLASNPLPTTIRFAELMATTRLRAAQTWRAAFALKRDAVDGGLFGLSPHAPYTTTAGLIRQAVTRCKRWQRPIMMHLAESRDELQWIENGDGPLQDLLEMVVGSEGLSTASRLPMNDYVYELCQAPLAFIVHGNYLDATSMKILEAHRHRVAVVYCPRTHAHFGHPRHPLLELRQHGIPVVLGTDSRASNPDLSIFDEARKVRQIFPEISAAEIMSMITTRPADFLGLESECGYLRPGGHGRLTAIPCQAKQAEGVLEELLENFEPPKPLEAVVGSLS